MRWKGQRQSENVEDRRGISPRGVAVGGLGALLIAVVAMFLGADPRPLLKMLGNGGAAPAAQVQGPINPEEEELKQFVSVVLADTEDVWNRLFPQQVGKAYREPTLVLFAGQVESACGFASAAMGPFYCPADEKVYVDLSFYNDLKHKFGAPGDFAQAYVIAHEIGHHVQKQLGISDQVQSKRSQLSQEAYNELSVRMELQADFLAGVWAHHAQQMRGMLEEGDIEEAINAATAIGDDRLQRQAQGYVVPESFTHGTSEQRASWFRKGLVSGDIKQGDTFNAREL